MAKCYVYIIRCCNGKNYPIKIGVADNPEKRMAELQTGSPYGLVLPSKIEMPSRKSAYELECWLHKRFDSARMSGEWFRSKGCNLKAAFRVWNSFSEAKAISENAYKHQNTEAELRDIIGKLKQENKSLRFKLKTAYQDMEEYLDGEINLDI